MFICHLNSDKSQTIDWYYLNNITILENDLNKMKKFFHTRSKRNKFRSMINTTYNIRGRLDILIEFKALYILFDKINNNKIQTI